MKIILTIAEMIDRINHYIRGRESSLLEVHKCRTPGVDRSQEIRNNHQDDFVNHCICERVSCLVKEHKCGEFASDQS